MSLPVGNPMYTTSTERLLYISFTLFTMGTFAGMIWFASRTALWETLFAGAIRGTSLDQAISLSGLASAALIGAGLVAIAVAVAMSIAAQAVVRFSRRWSG